MKRGFGESRVGDLRACEHRVASTIWKGHLTFGLVSIPVKLVRAARAEKIHMHHLQRDTGTRVRQVFVPQATGETGNLDHEPPPSQPATRWQNSGQAKTPAPPGREQLIQNGGAGAFASDLTSDPLLPLAARALEASPEPIVSRTELVRAFEYEKDKYVQFEREELERIAPKNSSAMEIIEFVRFAEVDPVYLESSYYVTPDKGGEKPYALLYEALKKTGYAAIAEFVMSRRDQTMILRPGNKGIIGHTLFYEDEVRRADEFQADAALSVPREMDLAIKLVDALAAPFEPDKFKDKYRERLQEAIAKKVDSGTVTAAAPAAAQGKPPVDIMAALKESLAKVKKPASSEISRPAARKKQA